jgi:3-dehydroquinate dehydratase-2
MPAAASHRILVLQGPNLNLLGKREPDKYGPTSLAEIDARLVELGGELGVEVATFQSNHEGALIDRIHEAEGQSEAILINPAGLTHTSVSLRDALLAVGLPFVEVHLTNVHAREPFRQRSLISDAAVGVITGLGPIGYELGLRALVTQLD